MFYHQLTSGEIAPFSIVQLEVIFNPLKSGNAVAEFEISFSDPLSPPVSRKHEGKLWKWRNDRRSEGNLCNCVKKPEKNSGLQRGLNPWSRDTGVMLYQQSHEATDVGSRSIVGSYVPVKEMSVNDMWNKSYMNCRNEMKMKKWSPQWTQFRQLRNEAWSYGAVSKNLALRAGYMYVTKILLFEVNSVLKSLLTNYCVWPYTKCSCRVTKKILNKFRHGKIILRIFFFGDFCRRSIETWKSWSNKESMFYLFVHWLIKQITLTETIFQGHTKIALSIS